MDTRVKLHWAGRAFLARLTELHGLEGAARVLRALADQLGHLTAV